MKIVSANYRDRKSPQHWLIRDEGASIESAVAHEAVSATGVIFGLARGGEEGFGCSTVAYCKTAVGGTTAPELVGVGAQRLKFTGLSFKDEQDNRVEECDQLVLGADGSMMAVIQEKVPLIRRTRVLETG